MTRSATGPTPKEDPFDKLLGDMGRWQLIVIITVSTVKLSSGWVQMAILFLTPKVTFWCTSFAGSSTIKAEKNTCYDECTHYEYDSSPFETSIISEWDLICNRHWLASFTQTVLQFGVLTGSIIFGYLSDRYGRKYTFLFASTSVIIFGFMVPFSPNYATFTLVRYLLGTFVAGTMVVSFVIVMEATSSKYRAIVGCLFQLPFIFGHMTIPLFAFFFRRWDQYYFAMALPPLIYLGYFCILSESPRWLVTSGRLEEATAIVKKAAIMNGLPTDKIEQTLQTLSAELSSKRPASKPNYSDLLERNLIFKTISSCYIWLVSGISFYGFNQYISQTSPDPFISVTAAGAIQLPSNFLSMWLIGHFGRKATTISFFFLGGMCIIALACVPDIFWVTLILGSMGVSCAAIAATTAYIYSSELFPTVVRNMGMGACSTFMRVGSMLAPFIANLTVTMPWLPTVIFGLVSITAGIVCSFLPETQGRNLPDSLEDSRERK